MLSSPNSILGNSNVVEHLEGHFLFHKKNDCKVIVGTQLSGHPHFGTLLTQMISSLIVKKINETFQVDTSLQIDFLDNTTVHEEIFEGVVYQKNLWQLEDPHKVITLLYTSLLRKYRDITNGSMSYSVFSESSQTFRLKAISVLDNKESIIPFLGHPTLRVACPKCGLMDKKGIHTQYFEGGVVRSQCPHHGIFQESLETTTFDINVLWRNLIKEFDIEPQDIIIKGTDWLPGCQKVDFAHKIVGSVPPTRIFLPLVVMDSGAKLSKSFIRKNPTLGTTIPPWLTQSSSITEEVLQFVVKFGDLILSDARHFYRSYTVAEIERLYQVFSLRNH